MLFDARKKADDFGDFLKSVYEHWKREEETKHEFSKHKRKISLLSNNKITKFKDIFRKDISGVPSCKLSIPPVFIGLFMRIIEYGV